MQLQSLLHPVDQRASSRDHDQVMRATVSHGLGTAQIDTMNVSLGSVELQL